MAIINSYDPLFRALPEELVMSRVRSAFSLMIALVSPFGMAILGAAITFALIHGGEPGPDEQAVPAHVGRVIVGHDKNGHVNVEVVEAELSTNLVIHGASGEALATLRLYQSGLIAFESMESDLYQFVVYQTPSRGVQIGAKNSSVKIVLSTLSNGSADMLVFDPARKPVYGVRVSEGGDIIAHEDVPAR
jgi:hypothetical protein